MAEPVIEIAVQALETALAEITKANGYETDVARVLSWHQDMEVSQPSGGGGVIVTGDYNETYEALLNDASQNDASWSFELRLWGISNARKRRSRFVADVRKRLMLGNEQDEWSDLSVLEVSVTGSQPFAGALDDEDVFGSIVRTAIRWRDRKVDPYSKPGTSGI